MKWIACSLGVTIGLIVVLTVWSIGRFWVIGPWP